MTWQYNHLALLPSNVKSHIVSQWTENLEQFPIENLSSLNRKPQPITTIQRVQRRLGMPFGDQKKHLGLLENVMRNVRPDVLHSHFGNCGWAAAGLARKYGVRHVVSFYGLDVGYLPRMDERWVARYREMSRRVDAVLCEGPHMARCLGEVGVDPEKVRVFRLGIDLDKIAFVHRNARRQGPKRFLIAGSFREKKGIPYALEALGMLARTQPDMEITVVGDSGGSEREEAEKRKIKGVVEQYGLGKKTRFLGYQPHSVLIEEFYRNDIFVSPSVTSADGDTEGGAPVTVIEAAASGMPVASTFHCDIPFILSEENRAYLAPERDSAALSNSIERLFECANWNPIVCANRQLIEKELNVRRQAQRLAEIYHSLN